VIKGSGIEASYITSTHRTSLLLTLASPITMITLVEVNHIFVKTAEVFTCEKSHEHFNSEKCLANNFDKFMVIYQICQYLLLSKFPSIQYHIPIYVQESHPAITSPYQNLICMHIICVILPC